MQELLSYRLSDLLLFSEQSYFRQFELYNQWLAPGLWLAYVYGLLFLFSLMKPERYLVRILFLISGMFWLVSAYGFVWQFYSAINWLAGYFIPLFIMQTVLILWAGIVWNPTIIPKPRYIFFNLGWLLVLSTLLVQPAIELYSGRNWSQLSVYAVTPDSLSFMAVASMLILRLPAKFFLPAALWLLFSTLTYIAMNSMTALFPAFALAIYLLSAFLRPSLVR